MKNNWISAVVAEALALLFIIVSTSALLNRAFIRGFIFGIVGLFFLSSVYSNLGLPVSQNHSLRHAIRVFVFVVVGAAMGVTLVAAISGTLTYPRKALLFLILMLWVFMLIMVTRTLHSRLRSRTKLQKL
jgi:hypothetical protein